MNIQTFPPPAILSDILLHTLWLEFDLEEAFIPAGISPYFALAVQGSAKIARTNEDYYPSPRFSLIGPSTEPMHAQYNGPCTAIITCFIPGMLNKASKVTCESLVNSLIDIQTLSDENTLQHFYQTIETAATTAMIIDTYHQFLINFLQPTGKKNWGNAFFNHHQKIFYPILELANYFGIGARQLERRVRNDFGLSLREIRRLTRFGFSIRRIMQEHAQWGDLTRIALDSGYYDQAHMYKEFSELAGISPTLLLQKIAAKDQAFWLYQLEVSDFNKLFIAIE